MGWQVSCRAKGRLDLVPEETPTVSGMSKSIRVLAAVLAGDVQHWEGIPAAEVPEKKLSWWRRAWRWLLRAVDNLL